MFLSERLIQESEERSRQAGVLEVRKAVQNKTVLSPPPGQMTDNELLLALLDPEKGFERIIGENDLVDESFLECALAAARPICRLLFRVNGHPAHATGFMVSPSVLLTNHHVFPKPESALEAIAEFNYKHGAAKRQEITYKFRCKPEWFYFANEQLDYVIVALDGQSHSADLSVFGFHKLSAVDIGLKTNQFISIIQHPGGAYRHFAIRENKLLRIVDPFILYVSDTAQGSSGAPAFNDNFELVAVHHSGVARKDDAGRYVLKNGGSAHSLNNIEDWLIDWECNEGIKAEAIAKDLLNNLDDHGYDSNRFAQEVLGTLMGTSKTDDIMTRAKAGNLSDLPGSGSGAVADAHTSNDRGIVSPAAPTAVAAGISAQHIHVHVMLDGDLKGKLTGTENDVRQEKLVEPYHHQEYSTRSGYCESFLGIDVPLPIIADANVITKATSGEHVLKYEHFSVVMHKQRRLAIYTAANVDGSAEARRPGGGIPTRRELTGLAANDQEKWFQDTRISAHAQLPDIFYTKDRGAFDKGHIVRREDVCWGETEEQIAIANGDTFHTTNCSPQVSDFNRMSKGGLWGKLEHYILQQAKADTDKYSLFAGPILADDDRWFDGRDVKGRVQVQIPRAFWKVVVVKKNEKLQAFGFMLEQSLRNVPLEFAVSDAWAPYLMPIEELEEQIGCLKFPDAVRKADQYSEDFKTHLEERIKSGSKPKERYRLRI